MLSARLVMVKLDVDVMLETGRPLSGVEIEALFRRALERELRSWAHDADQNAPWSSAVSVVAAEMAEACKALRGPGRPASLPVTPSYENEDDARWNGPSSDVGQILEALSDDHMCEELRAIGAIIELLLVLWTPR